MKRKMLNLTHPQPNKYASYDTFTSIHLGCELIILELMTELLNMECNEIFSDDDMG